MTPAPSPTGSGSGPETPDRFLAKLRSFEGRSGGAPEPSHDPVNQAMIRHWCHAIGDANPIYLDPEAAASSSHGQVIAPPAMLQAWTMRGLVPPAPYPGRAGKQDGPGAQDWDNDQYGPGANDELMALLDEAGFTSVVATNCEQEYYRDLVLGDRLSRRSVIESVSEEKSTGLGVGHFLTTRSDFVDADGQVVATMMFRILKFRPPQRPPVADGLRPRPSITQDNAFFFEGAKRHQLLIQRCASCLTLRHPPQPACAECGSFKTDTALASGRGQVYSFVVNHYPQVPAFDYPLVIALIELEEGTRLVANLIGVTPEQTRVGMAVQAEFVDFDDDLSLPQFRPVA
ncbi:MAG: bifunctional MaoC family dehydratase N-terminal/OB-fold nucleic acid binding domain-containing protein [Acidimicrobiales bacterium]